MNQNDNTDWQTMQSKLDSLPKEIEPARDLWPFINNSIHSENNFEKPQVMGWIPWSMAASIVIAVSSLCFSWYSWHSFEQYQANQSVQFEQWVEFRLMEQQHQLMKVNFLQQLDEHEAVMDSAVVSDIRNNLMVLDGALKDIKLAIEQEPDNLQVKMVLQP